MSASAEQRAREWLDNQGRDALRDVPTGSDVLEYCLARYGKSAALAALEEAARRTCRMCQRNEVLVGRVHQLKDGMVPKSLPYREVACPAAAIHGLIAELREGK